MAVLVRENQKAVVVVDNAKVTYRVYASGKAVQENVDARVKRQGNLRTVEAVKGVSMVAYEGDVIGVIGT
ncbi:MAG: ABC transporter ATP-binding protein, partial [Aquiluna sp.]